MESIAPGHHLYTGPDGTWRSCDENERFARLSGQADLLERMREQAYRGGSAPDLEPLAAVLRERGVLTPLPGEDADEGELRVCVRGDGPVAVEVARLLETARNTLLDDDPRTADALVECTGWLPDERWRRVDAGGGVWHRCHVEGRRLVVGPMTVPGRTASYRDLRGRRLAAAALPDELAGLWSYLDDGLAGTAPLPPVPWPNAGAVAIAAGLLVNDLLTWRDGGLPATAGFQLVVDPASGRVDRHPVLPLPVA
ncbi:hypothetical protein [Streptosporangium carneum]|uniref:Uncharacterized protein n=1 Tax=Streptosporangium carneum TaxID=47481 RepID=A0A9W6I328_9ACTN|nr:hypothetical protein [Streptosporangium carneum]GLK10084.1 hypothetical protein GCM10017600_34900 [Streptosporangium carneum]